MVKKRIRKISLSLDEKLDARLEQEAAKGVPVARLIGYALDAWLPNLRRVAKSL